MAVLADAGERDIDRVLRNQRADARQLSPEIRSIAPDGVKAAKPGQEAGKALVKVTPEARRVAIRHANVFVEMEDIDQRPVEVAPQYECRK